MNVQATTNADPAAPERNRHHTHSHIYRNQAEWDAEVFGRGPGDPDAHGYPGQVEPELSDEPQPTQPF